MSRISDSNPVEPKYRAGLNGNAYVYCVFKWKLLIVSQAIGKAVTSIYFNKTHKVWVIRVVSKKHKEALKAYFGGDKV